MSVSVLARLVLVALAAVLASASVGCTGDGEGSTRVGDALQPAPWDLSTPESAVRSYLDWVSLSYRMANSDIPVATMTPDEAVRVDSYIQLNRMEGKGIEQSLEVFELGSVSQEASSAVVTAYEVWTYRYFSLQNLEYVSEPLEATYDTTYTLEASPAGWVVARVEAEPAGDVK